MPDAGVNRDERVKHELEFRGRQRQLEITERQSELEFEGQRRTLELDHRQQQLELETKQRRGYYTNDGGKKNNAKIATTVNKCDITGEHWVSIIAKKTIKPNAEVHVPYGRNFARP